MGGKLHGRYSVYENHGMGYGGEATDWGKEDSV
jgi:hypothetical protein